MEASGDQTAVRKKESSNSISSVEVNDKKSYLMLKRVLDVFASLCGIIFLSPLFIVVALLIKIQDSKGPVFFKQIRVGKDEKEFYIYKFRSMVTDAELRLVELLEKNETTGAMFKMKNDPRVTKIGSFIRKTSIDELPQLWNVLKGEMSLVGPRPPLPREVDEYTTYDKQRLLVTPGCTGVWQVSGRNELGFEEMVELDLIYIRKRKFTTDIKLIIKTIYVMIFRKDGF